MKARGKIKQRTSNSQKGAELRRGQSGAISLSDHGQLPAIFVDEYHDLVRAAERKLDRLRLFSSDQLEDFVCGGKNVSDWNIERTQAIKILVRYDRDASKVISELEKLIRSVRASKRLIELCQAECLGRDRVRQKWSEPNMVTPR